MNSLLQKLNRHRWGLSELMTLWIDMRYGGYIGGRTKTRFSEFGAHDTHNIPYRLIKNAMAGVSIEPADILADIGCGKGRVLNWWLHLGLKNRLIGVELDPDVAASTRRRLARYPNVSIVAGDAVQLTPRDATICFLFNPFNEAVVQRWHDAMIQHSTAERLTVIYVHCEHLNVFEQSGHWNITILPKPPGEFCDIAVLKRQS